MGFLGGVCRVFVVVVLVLLVTWLAVDTSKRPEQLISFGGVCLFVLLLFLTSAHRTEVSFAKKSRLRRAVAVDDEPFRKKKKAQGRLSEAAFAEDLPYRLCPCAHVIFSVIIGISGIASW